MRIYPCPTCQETLFFDNLQCSCGTEVGYDPVLDTFSTQFEPCTNGAAIGCNWIAPGGGLCQSCAMTRTHPDLAVEGNTALWGKAELAKRRVLANLMSFGWFSGRDGGPRPTFDFLAEETADGPARPVMGHAAGHITINATESDPAEIVRRREAFGEPYRTMVGHVRHEMSHFLHWRKQGDAGFAEACRSLFGDERLDYGDALERFYAHGPAPGWQDAHVTAYAAAHPHEDWAETLAHVMLLLDVVSSAQAMGLARYEVYRDSDHALTEALQLDRKSVV